jgi:cell division protein FtsL
MVALSNKKSGTLRIILILSLATVITLFFVWTRLQNIRLKRELARLKQTEQKLVLENGHHQLEWARLTLPKRLEEIGAEKYNLKRPRPEQIIVLPEPLQ